MTNHESERIQAEYLARLRRILRRVPVDIRKEAVREVQSHIVDEWQELGGSLPALKTVLDRLGPPEEYGRDLALQLMLLPEHGRRSSIRLVWAAAFWISTNLIGVFLALCAALIYAWASGMVVVAVLRLLGQDAILVHKDGFRFLSYYAEQLNFPPQLWSPGIVALTGLLPAVLFSVGFYCLYRAWMRRFLARRELIPVMEQPASALPHGWESRALVAISMIAILGLFNCLFFSLLSQLVLLGRGARVELPLDFFRNLLAYFALLGAIIFFSSPVLGLWWIARRTRS